MNKLFKIFLMASMMQSCGSQTDFDLTQLTLKGEKIGDFVTKDMTKQVYPLVNKTVTDKEYIIVKSDKLLKFNSTNLIGRQNPNSHKYGINGVSFYYTKVDSIIYKYTISIYSKKQAKDLLKALYEKLGKPNYTSYRSAEDKEKNNFNALLWEDTVNNHLYQLRYGLNGTVKANLEVKNNSTNIQELNIIRANSHFNA